MNAIHDKNYTILLFPEEDFIEKIQDFRIKYTWATEVDGIPHPHITLKRRFCAKAWFEEQCLINTFQSYTFGKGEILFNSIEMYGDAIVLKGESVSITKIHLEILRLLEDKIITKNPEYEWSNFGIHLTLFRLNDTMNKADILTDAKNLLGNGVRAKSITLGEIGMCRDYYKELHSLDCGQDF